MATDTETQTEMLDRMQEQRAAAVMREREQQEARDAWPATVNAALRALGGKVEELEARLAAVERD